MTQCFHYCLLAISIYGMLRDTVFDCATFLINCAAKRLLLSVDEGNCVGAAWTFQRLLTA